METGVATDQSLTVKIKRTIESKRISLPPLPEIINRLQDVLSDEDNASSKKVAYLVRTEPAVVATLLKLANTIIVTRGEQGSLISTPDGEISIPAVKAKKVVDPTGAGDAYRGGLISGLLQGKSIEHCARMGSACASFSVECYGTQDYSFSSEEFNDRLSKCQ